MGWIASHDFGDIAEARVGQVVLNGLQEFKGGGAVSVDTVVCLHERPEQPGPDRTLMIRAVALARTADVVATIFRITRTQ